MQNRPALSGGAVSFNLHSISCTPSVERRPSGFFTSWTCKEPLRLGTPALLRGLAAEGHELWVYTASMRSPTSVKWQFHAHGVSIRRVVNAQVHRTEIRRLGERLKTSTKYPPAFGIDLLIDNCDGVVAESLRYHYPVLQVRPDDAEWAQTVMSGVAAVEKRAA